MLCVFAQRLVGPTDAEDAVQQALVKLFGAAHRYELGRDVVPWALSLTAWECRTLARRRARERARTADVDLGLLAQEGDPEDALLERAALSAAEAALGALSDDDRAALAAALETDRAGPLSAAERKRKQRALAKLRSHLGSLLGWQKEERRG